MTTDIKRIGGLLAALFSLAVVLCTHLIGTYLSERGALNGVVPEPLPERETLSFVPHFRQDSSFRMLSGDEDKCSG